MARRIPTIETSVKETHMVAESTPFSLSAFSNAISQRVRGAAPSVVSVHSHHSRASGFAWRPGRIVTADETLADDGRVEVLLPGGESVEAKVRGRDPTTDIALLAIDRNDLPATSNVVAPAVETGALAIVVGTRDGGPVAALGLAAHVGPAWRSMRGGRIDARIELGVALRASSEGGLVLDANGGAIGMAVFGPRRRVLAIPMQTIDRVAAQLDAEGRIRRGYLGLGLQSVRTSSGEVGAMVMSADASGPAARAGVRQGDVIVRRNGEALQGVATLLHALGSESVGTTMRLGVQRAGEPVEFDVTIVARPGA
jgi:S1-C subfamily serine protease